jgi:hypothetical protein
MKYLSSEKFSVASPGTKQYADNWDAIFKPKEQEIDLNAVSSSLPPPAVSDEDTAALCAMEYHFEQIRHSKRTLKHLYETSIPQEAKVQFCNIWESHGFDICDLVGCTHER